MRIWGRNFNVDTRLINMYNDETIPDNPEKIELSWLLSGELIKIYGETFDASNHTSVYIREAEQDNMKFRRLYGSKYQRQVDNFSSNMVGLFNYKETKAGLTVEVQDGSIYISGVMTLSQTAFILPYETTYNLKQGDNYWAYYVSSSNLSGINLFFILSTESGHTLMETPSSSSSIKQGTIEYNEAPDAVVMFVYAESANSIPQGTKIDLEFSKDAKYIGVVDKFEKPRPTFDYPSNIIDVGDKLGNDTYINLSVSNDNLFSYLYKLGTNVSHSYSENYGGYVIQPTVTGSTCQFIIGIQNNLMYGYPYHIYYETSGRINSIKLYATRLGTSELLEELPINNTVFQSPNTGKDMALVIDIASDSLDNVVVINKLRITFSEDSNYISRKAYNYMMQVNEPLKEIGVWKDLMALETLNVLNPETQSGNVLSRSDYYFVTDDKSLVAYMWYYDKDGNLLNSGRPQRVPTSGSERNLITTYENAASFHMTKSSTNPNAHDITASQITSKHLMLIYYRNYMTTSYYPYISQPSLIKRINRITLNKSNLPAFSYTPYDDFVWVTMDLDNLKTGRDSSQIYVISNYFKGISLNDWNTGTSINTITSGGSSVAMFRVPRASKFSPDITEGDFKTNFENWVQAKADEGKPWYIDYVLDEPIVTNLTEKQIESLQKPMSVEGIMYAMTDNKIRGVISTEYVRGYDTSQAQVYASLDVSNPSGTKITYESDKIPYPTTTDKIFIWLRRKGETYDLAIENLHDYHDSSSYISKNNSGGSATHKPEKGGINFISVENGIYDHIHITRDVKFAYNTTIPSVWDKPTILNASFNNTPNAGNVDYSLSQITAIRIKRRLKGTFEWMTLKEIPVKKLSDIHFNELDFLAQSNVEYEYALVLLIGNIESEYMIDDAVGSYYGIFVTDGEEIFKFKEGASYSSNERVHSTGVYEPYGSKYPVIVSNGRLSYDKGTVTGSVILVDENEQLDRKAIVDKLQRIKTFLATPNAKVLKDMNGNIWLIAITDNLPINYYSEVGMGFADVSFNWTEIGNANNGQDLADNNLIHSDN